MRHNIAVVSDFWGALQIQDRSPQSRPVASRNQSQTDATGLHCGDWRPQRAPEQVCRTELPDILLLIYLNMATAVLFIYDVTANNSAQVNAGKR